MPHLPLLSFASSGQVNIPFIVIVDIIKGELDELSNKLEKGLLDIDVVASEEAISIKKYLSSARRMKKAIDAKLSTIDEIRELSKTSKKVIAIGEIGLDYYWENTSEIKEKQKIMFKEQISLAN